MPPIPYKQFLAQISAKVGKSPLTVKDKIDRGWSGLSGKFSLHDARGKEIGFLTFLQGESGAWYHQRIVRKLMQKELAKLPTAKINHYIISEFHIDPQYRSGRAFYQILSEAMKKMETPALVEVHVLANPELLAQMNKTLPYKLENPRLLVALYKSFGFKMVEQEGNYIGFQVFE